MVKVLLEKNTLNLFSFFFKCYHKTPERNIKNEGVERFFGLFFKILGPKFTFSGHCEFARKGYLSAISFKIENIDTKSQAAL